MIYFHVNKYGTIDLQDEENNSIATYSADKLECFDALIQQMQTVLSSAKTKRDEYKMIQKNELMQKIKTKQIELEELQQQLDKLSN